METYLRNVPVDLTDDSLKKELTPYMNALGIVDWVCDKPRHKPQAWVSFLTASDGAKFLAQHGKLADPAPPKTPQDASSQPNGRPRDVARLYILKTPIYVDKSKRSVTALTLKHLKHEHEERKRAPERAPRAPASLCNVTQLACGKNVFGDPSETLTFAQQSSFSRHGIAKFGRRFLTVTFDDELRMDVAYGTVLDFIADYAVQLMTMILSEPPRFYAKTPSPSNPLQQWERTTSFPQWPNHDKYVAHCLVYQITTAVGHSQVIQALRNHEALSVTRQSLSMDLHPAPYTHDYSTSINSFEGKMRDLGNARIVPFPILFNVQALVWNNYLHPAGARQSLEMIERLAQDPKWTRESLPLTTEAMSRVMHRIPYPRPGVEAASLSPSALVDDMVREELKLRENDPLRSTVYGPRLAEHQTWVFKALVTPTRILLQGPDQESLNRVLRLFPGHAHHFLRVSFCDEDGQDLQFNFKVSNDLLFERYRNVLRHGIQIAGRRFTFLGFSHSSLRAHSTWFLAPFVDKDMQRQDYHSILKTLGDFSDIRVPAKCAARIGQAFSETPYHVNLFKAGILTRSIPDVKSADGSRVFSDGVGSISRDALEEVWAVLPPRLGTPTCFQIRWGGFKGMIALDSTLPGKVICVREESMMKFSSRDLAELGICDAASKPLRLVLNRQIIKILEDMGTDEAWFHALQNKALKTLRGVTATAANTSTFLQYQDIGSTLGFPSFITQLDKMGIDYRRDSFLKAVVEHVVLRELRLLKHKARIPVDMGVTLFGIMDESGFLEENEVYVTYEKTHARSGCRMDASLADGPVIVTRCPALHPGDIQCARMRTPPAGHALRDLENCIVFSQHGARDLPSQLSGGDLDGDLYNVIWDPRARPAESFPPADYPRVSPEPLERPVTRDDIADFFINFMATDILGLIANRHQVLADVQPGGTNDWKCIALAEMHSTAVDYSKTGIPVSLQDMPKAPRTRPDFLAPAPPVKLYELGQISHIEDGDGDDGDAEDGMGRAKPRYHASEKILGALYRGVDEKKIWDEDIHRRVDTDGPSVWEQLMGRVKAELDEYCIDTDFERYVKEAWKLRNLYEDSILNCMWQYSDTPMQCITEVEVYCGSVLNKTGTQTRQQRDASGRLKDETDRIMSLIVKQMRHRGGGHATASDDGEASERDAGDDAVQLCWACLVVGSSDNSATAAETGAEDMRSFRVVAATCLLREMNVLRSRVKARAAAMSAGAGGGFVGVAGGRVPPSRPPGSGSRSGSGPGAKISPSPVTMLAKKMETLGRR